MAAVLLRAVLLLVAAVLVAVALVRWMESRMIFHPERDPMATWEPRSLGFDAVDLEVCTEDGLNLHAWLFRAREPKWTFDLDRTPVLLWSHGNAGNLTFRGPHAQALADLGLHVLVFDYRGYGRSDGTPSEEGIYRDGMSFYRLLTGARGIDPERIVLYGRSLGSAVAAHLAERVPHAGLILVSPFTSARAMARRIFFGFPFDLLGRARFDVEGMVASRTRPMMVIHGRRDEVVPYKMGLQVYAAAAEPKEFVELASTGHNDILVTGGDRYLQSVSRFARASVNAAYGSLER